MSEATTESEGAARRVVITGIGLVTPFAADRETSFLRILEGRTATDWLPDSFFAHHEKPSQPGQRAGAMAPQLPASLTNSAHDLVTQLALQATTEAVTDAALPLPGDANIGCVIGTSKGGLRSAAKCLQSPKTFSAEQWSAVFPNAPAVAVAERFGLRGPLLCPVAACATGLMSLIRGAQLIQQGDCDVVLAGSTDASLQPVLLASYSRLGVLANHFDDPHQACRPYHRDREGFLVGEGAAVLVLEEAEAARRRGVIPYAEWLGAACACDPTSLTQQEDEPESLCWLLKETLRKSGCTAKEIDYLNLHGTGTVSNDRQELTAIRHVFGSAAQSLGCSSLKGSIGHLLGAAGSVETAVTLLAMRDHITPPTCNLEHSDDHEPLDLTPYYAFPERSTPL